MKFCHYHVWDHLKISHHKQNYLILRLLFHFFYHHRNHLHNSFHRLELISLFHDIFHSLFPLHREIWNFGIILHSFYRISYHSHNYLYKHLHFYMWKFLYHFLHHFQTPLYMNLHSNNKFNFVDYEIFLFEIILYK